ncbi:MAG: sigma-70 family RNA polymerase sigma factor [Kofleriaceae bacterium]
MKPSPEAVLDDLEGLRALARSLVHGDTEADDLIQDTAIAAITHPPDGERPARPWLATVLRNRWRMNRRTDSRRRAREHAVAPDDVTDDANPEAAAERIDRARVLERLAAALVALDEPFRTTVIRRYLDGESAADIARAQGVPPGTVRWRLKTGLDRLRAELDKSQPRWKRALVPFVAVKGAAVVKAKTSFAILIALIALFGTVFYVIVKARGTDDAKPPAVSGSNRSGEIAKTPTTKPAPIGAGSADAPAPIGDPLPGQGRATLVMRPAAGGAVAGRVINWSTGDGVANAELTFTGDGGAQTVRSDQRGAFVLAPSAPGRFVLTAVVAPSFLPYAPELSHSSVHVDLAKDRAVEGITVFLFPAIDYTGKVVDANGAPVAGAKVKLLGTPSGEQMIEKLETEWTSGKDGTFIFHAADDAVFEASRGNKRGWARLDGDVAITHRLEIAIGDAPARDAKITGKVTDLDGVALADVLVRAIPSDRPAPTNTLRPEPPAPRATAFATTGPDGSFVLEGLDRDLYALAAEAPEHANVVKDGIAGGTKNVALVLDPGFILGGQVVTTSGEPVPAYTLLVMRRLGVAREMVTTRSIVEPDGKFRVRVTSGEYELVASASGLAPSAPTVAGAGDKDAKIVVSEGATLTGKVIDATSGAPLPYARVMREGAGGGASAQPANAGTVTREDGTFELTGIPPGPLSITVGAGEHHPKIEAGMMAVDGATLGPLIVALTKLRPGETPTLELVGIGVKLRAEHEAILVEFVMPESGAAAAGIVAGDLIVAVDGVDIATLGIDGAVSRIRGVAGTKVSVTLRRGDKDLELVVERKKLKA